jgi:pilus assembly protein CpaD
MLPHRQNNRALLVRPDTFIEHNAMKSARVFTLVVTCALGIGLGGCFAKPPIDMPDASSIGYDGHSLVPPDCATLSQPSLLTDAGFHRPSMEWGCATYTNLAAQIAHPEDGIAPHALGPANAAVAASAVHRYVTGQLVPTDTTTVRDAK